MRKQREVLESAPEALEGYVTKGSLVLSAWHLDPEFLDAKGKPIPLDLQADAKGGVVRNTRPPLWRGGCTELDAAS